MAIAMSLLNSPKASGSPIAGSLEQSLTEIFARESRGREQAAIALATVLYVDHLHLSRDCISEHLAAHLPNWAIRSAASIRDASILADLSKLSLIVFNSHGARLGSQEARDEMLAIRETAPGTPFVVMSDLEDAGEVREALGHGARGYLPPLPLGQVMAAIRFVGDGGTYIPLCVLTTHMVQKPSSACLVDGNGDPVTFSPRQLQVLQLLRQGKQNKTIAYELDMCESTVKVHIRLIMRKLNARNRTQVVLLAEGIQTRDISTRAA